MSEIPVYFVGDRSPSISDVVTVDGVPQNLTGSSARFKAREVGTTALLVDQPVSNVLDATGLVRYDWSAADVTAPDGVLSKERPLVAVWWEITASGKKQTVNEAVIEVRAHSPETNAYVELEEFKDTATLTGSTYADRDLQLALVAASRGIDYALGQRFYADTADQTRYYTAELEDVLRIDPLVSLTSLATAPGSDGVFSQAWVLDTDFVLEPRSAPGEGRPYTSVRRLPAGKFGWPDYPEQIRIVGKFGWPVAVPAAIKQLTTMIAARLVKRTREAPSGFIAFGMDGATTRASDFARDPEYNFLAAPYRRKRLFV